MARPPAVSAMSLTDLERMVADRRKAIGKLEKERRKWQRKVDQIDRELAVLGGAVNGRATGGRRPRNDKSLPDTIADVLARASGPLGVAEIMQQVQASGYRSDSANFRGIVNQMLIKDKRFRSTSRGVYCMVGAGKTNGSVRKARKTKKQKPRQAAETSPKSDPAS